jgi:hypothetical protein
MDFNKFIADKDSELTYLLVEENRENYNYKLISQEINRTWDFAYNGVCNSTFREPEKREYRTAKVKRLSVISRWFHNIFCKLQETSIRNVNFSPMVSTLQLWIHQYENYYKILYPEDENKKRDADDKQIVTFSLWDIAPRIKDVFDKNYFGITPLDKCESFIMTHIPKSHVCYAKEFLSLLCVYLKIMSYEVFLNMCFRSTECEKFEVDLFQKNV